MWKSVKQELAVQKAMLYWNLGVVFVAWMIGVGMMVVVQAVTKGADQSYFCIGTMIALMAVCVISLVVGGMVIYTGFDDAVHMGKTRKRFLPAVSLVLFLFCLSGLVLTALLCKVEAAVYGMLYPNFEWEPGPEKYLGFRWLLGYASAITGLACVYSGIIKVNRKIGGAFCLAVWIIACWSMSGIGGVDGDNRSFFTVFEWIGYRVSRWYASFSVGIRIGILFLIGAAGYAVMYTLLIGRAADT